MSRNQTKYIFVTGGVMSSLGKGISASALGALLENRGLKVSFVKLDPYVNVDPGTMNPLQHGEVFVTDDGAETDLDLGNYERFTTARMTKANNFTTGQIYDRVISRERRGEYLGRTVQVIPHITDEIKESIYRACEGADIGIVEVGGTVGDIESLPFLEAVRQARIELGDRNSVSIHVTPVLYIAAAEEMKTKPTQHSVKALREIGIQPEFLICRSERDLSEDLKRKIALFCNVDPKRVITARDVQSIYEMPLLLAAQGLDHELGDALNIWSRATDLSDWERIVDRIKNPKHHVEIAIVGKYIDFSDAYKSLNEALFHGGIENEAKVNLRFVDAELLEKDNWEALLDGCDGVLVPGGFGERGTEGKVKAINYARTRNVPFFGICLGMQLAVVEYARNVCGWEDADSHEFDPDTEHPVIALMAEQKDVVDMGGTMRLGAYPCVLKTGSRAAEIYNSIQISERHRHRFEVNNAFREQLEANGLVISGTSPDEVLVEMVELPDHPWFIACQFHPEFQSHPTHAHPLFASYIAACIK
ncbi:CTP synthase [Bradymonas sediminis]|uniref:CTP synthase n=1 Tax=Bradymonas sediminis TaxID=1548548 RepID=A0A2Z4FKW2_9DELT|nr:CTP synthase [Bradymonas sediminis]AWV89470.1 CTP synthetase [Bradymonas sediminis]TDP76804.1 CTP synthase [Bradymonas sediminis]